VRWSAHRWGFRERRCQGYLRNPLAEPSLVGVSGGAALGAVLTIHLGLSAAFALTLRSELCLARRGDAARWWHSPAITADR
jgi:hypothetical protein